MQKSTVKMKDMVVVCGADDNNDVDGDDYIKTAGGNEVATITTATQLPPHTACLTAFFSTFFRETGGVVNKT